MTETLFSCQQDIFTACRPSDLPQLNLTFMAECDQLVSQFKAGAQECLDKIIGVNSINTIEVKDPWRDGMESTDIET